MNYEKRKRKKSPNNSCFALKYLEKLRVDRRDKIISFVINFTIHCVRIKLDKNMQCHREFVLSELSSFGEFFLKFLKKDLGIF